MRAMNEGVNGSIEITVDVPADTDGDGMPDDWEKKYGFNKNDPADGPQDFDGDGLSNAEEYRHGTNPRAIDTDHDGLMDGAEVQRGTDPAVSDTDHDGLNDGQEVLRGLDPLSADTDHDGIADGVELQLGMDATHADPVTTVQGRVVDGSGVPVAGASVTVFDLLVTNSGPAGFFTVQAVPANRGAFAVSARIVRSGQLLQGASGELAPVANGVTDAGVITLHSNSWTVSGTVRDPQNQVVGGARVTITSGADVRHTTTASNGVYSISNMPAGAVTVTARDPRTGLRGRSTGSLQPGGAAVINVQLGPYGTVTGTVYQPDGATPAGSGVLVGISGHYGTLSSVTNSLGKYRIDFVPIGSFRLEAGDGSGNRGMTSGNLLSTSQVVVAGIVFQGRGRVSGVVRNGGAGVAGAEVTLVTGSPIVATYTATTDSQGAYTIDRVFVSQFTVNARTTAVPPLAGRNTGSMPAEGAEVTTDVDLELSGSIFGLVVGASGQPAGGAVATLTPGGLTTATGADGSFEFAGIPYGQYTVDILEPLTMDRARATATLAGADLNLGQISLNGLGTVTVTVVDGGGSAVVAGALVTVRSLGQFGGSWQGITDANGATVISGVLAGPVRADALDVATELSGSGNQVDLAAGGTVAVTVQLQVAGSIHGTIYSPDGTTPAAGMTVRVKGPVERDLITSGDGLYSHQLLPAGDYIIEVYDSTDALRARYPMPGSGDPPVMIRLQGDSFERNLTAVGIGTVTGTVTRSDAQSAVGTRVIVRSLNPVFGATLTGTVGFGETYTIDHVPAGDFVVTASAPPFFAQRSDLSIAIDGQIVQADLSMSPSTGIPLPYTLYDANQFPFEIQPDGTIERGAVNVFRGSRPENRGAMQLDVVSGETPMRFSGDTMAQTDQAARELIIAQPQPIAGLTVTRSVYTKLEGYFTRYLDVLENSSGSSITVDIVETTNFRKSDATDPRVVGSSNNDTSLDAQDQWVIVDDGTDSDPNTGSVPAVGILFAGSGAALPVASASLDPSSEEDCEHVVTRWNSVIVPAGGKVGLLTVVVQQSSRAAAAASMARLAQFPSELYEGLSADEIGWTKNMSLPQTPGVVPLPPLTGQVTGQALAQIDSALTPVANASVSFQSTNPLFGRQQWATADSSGHFEIRGVTNVSGPWQPVPVDNYLLQARNPVSGTYSPLTPGSFPEGFATSTQDVIFSDAGNITGTVRYSDPNQTIVSGGTVKIISGPVSNIIVPIQAIGTYNFSALPEGDYTLEATAPNAYLKATVQISVLAGSTAQADIWMPPTGELLEGTVSRDGSGVSGVWMTLTGDGGLVLQTTSGTGGYYLFLTIPTGSYTLEAFDPNQHTGASGQVVIGQDARATLNLELAFGGTVEGIVRKDGAPADGVHVTWSGQSVPTSGGGHYSFQNVPLGAVSVSAIDPATNLRAYNYGTLTYSGEVLTLDLDLIASGSVHGVIYAHDGTTPVSGVQVRAYDAYMGYSADTTSDAAGNYQFPAVPVDYLHDYSIDAYEPNTGQTGQALGRMTASGEEDVVPVTLNGLGTVTVDVKDANGWPLGGAQVTVGNFVSYTNPGGTVTFASVPAGLVGATAVDPITGLSDSGSGELQDGQTLIISLQMQESGMIFGRVHNWNGEVVSNAYVQAYGRYTYTDELGYYEFRYLPIREYYVRASWNNHASAERYADLRAGNHQAQLDLDLVANAMVDVRLSPPEGLSGIDVCLSSSNRDVPYSRCLRVSSAGPHRFADVPAGSFFVSAYGNSRSGSGQGEVMEDGSIVDVDINLAYCPVTLPVNLFDANQFKYDVTTHGGLPAGSNAFSSGGEYLSLNTTGGAPEEEAPFAGVGCMAALEENGREVIVSNSQVIHGVQVTRKVYVPSDGYFARYLEILTNPSETQAVTVDVILKSTLHGSSQQVVSTSSGDSVLDATDDWVALSGEYPPSEPATAFVFGMPGAGLNHIAQASFDAGSRTLSYRWEGVALQPGQTIILMHVVSQQFWENGAIGSAQRLLSHDDQGNALLPPELLVGLAQSEIPLIANFIVPADGSSPVPPLVQPEYGVVSGHVWAADGATPVPTTVILRSHHPIFGKVFRTTTSDSNGHFNISQVPVDDYTLTADAGLIDEPSVVGHFEEGQLTDTEDLLFTNIGVIKGTVTDAGDQPVFTGLDLYPGPISTTSRADDGKYAFLLYSFNPWYSLRVIEPITKIPIYAAPDPVVNESSPVYQYDFHLPPVGYLNAHVNFARGAAAGGSGVEINYGNAVLANAQGDLVKPLIAGDYIVAATHPGSAVLIPPSSPVNFTINTSNQQQNVTFTLPAAATIELHVRNENADPVDAHVTITSYQMRYGSPTEVTRDFDTAGGQVVIPLVSEGQYKIVAVTGDNRSGQVIDSIGQAQDNTTVPVNLTVREITGTVYGRVLAADEMTTIVGAQVAVYDAGTGQLIAGPVLTDADGYYQFPGVQAGGAGILVTAAAFPGQGSHWDASVSAEGHLNSDGTPLALDLIAPVALVTGRFIYSNGDPVADGDQTMELVSAPEPEIGSFETTDHAFSNGDFVFLVPNYISSFTVTADDSSTGGGAEGTGQVGGQSVIVIPDLVIPVGAVQGTTLPDATVALEISRGGSQSLTQSVQSDSAGFYNFSHVPPGCFTVSANYSSQTFGQLTASGQTATLNIPFAGAQSLTGVVVDSDDLPVAGAQVAITFETGVTIWATDAGGTASDGAFAFSGLPSGKGRVQAYYLSEIGLIDVDVPSAPVTVRLGNGRAAAFSLGPVSVDCDGSIYASPLFGLRAQYGPDSCVLPCPYPELQVEDSGRETVVGPVSFAGLRVTRKVFVPESGNFVRYLEILENPTSEEISLPIRILGSTQWNIPSLYVNPASTGGTYGIATYAGAPQLAVTGFVFAGNGPVTLPASIDLLGVDSAGMNATSYSWNVTIPPGDKRIIMHFLIQRPYDQAAAVQSQALSLVELTDPEALEGMAADEKSAAVNFAIPSP